MKSHKPRQTDSICVCETPKRNKQQLRLEFWGALDATSTKSFCFTPTETQQHKTCDDAATELNLSRSRRPLELQDGQQECHSMQNISGSLSNAMFLQPNTKAHASRQKLEVGAQIGSISFLLRFHDGQPKMLACLLQHVVVPL